MLGNLIAYIEKKAEQKRQRQAKCAAFVEKHYKILDNGMVLNLGKTDYIKDANELITN